MTHKISMRPAIAAALQAHSPAVAVEDATPDDADFLRRTYVDERAAEFAGLDAAMASALIDMQWRARTVEYERSWPQQERMLILKHGRKVGRLSIGVLAAAEGAGAVHIIDIALLASERGQATGAAVITAVKDATRATLGPGSRVSLSVLKQNDGAIRLYRRLGFAIQAADDALYQTMACELAQQR